MKLQLSFSVIPAISRPLPCCAPSPQGVAQGLSNSLMGLLINLTVPVQGFIFQTLEVSVESESIAPPCSITSASLHCHQALNSSSPLCVWVRQGRGLLLVNYLLISAGFLSCSFLLLPVPRSVLEASSR